MFYLHRLLARVPTHSFRYEALRATRNLFYKAPLPPEFGGFRWGR
jgi:hypothetical protein